MKALAGFLALTLAVTIGLAATGRSLLPRWYGSESAEAAVWAAAVVFLGSLLGALPLLRGGSADDWKGPAGASRFLAAMLLRLVAVGLGAAAVGLLGGLPLEPFLIWLGACYLVLLVVDTAFALRTFRSL